MLKIIDDCFLFDLLCGELNVQGLIRLCFSGFVELYGRMILKCFVVMTLRPVCCDWNLVCVWHFCVDQLCVGKTHAGRSAIVFSIIKMFVV